MSKVLKVVATVAAVALAIPSGGTSLLAATLGVSSLAATAMVAGLTIASGLLAKKKAAGSPSATDRLNANINPRAPRAIVFGRTALRADVR